MTDREKLYSLAGETIDHVEVESRTYRFGSDDEIITNVSFWFGARRLTFIPDGDYDDGHYIEIIGERREDRRFIQEYPAPIEEALGDEAQAS